MKKSADPETQYSLFDSPEATRFAIHAHKTKYGVHYDFRFECGNVLVDYCLPHGFSVNPAHVRRALEQPAYNLSSLTMPESCQPMEDGNKEVMMRWDEGTMEVLGLERETQSERFERGLREGSLRIELSGLKLKGVWLFVRDRRGWKVQKEKDRHASTRNVLRENWSVLTRRSFPMVAAEMGIHDGVRFTPYLAA
jgi:hypothetical protein